MKTPNVITVDYETDAIQGRPDYPPKPCGVSIMYPGRAARYYAWCHPSDNNCSSEDGRNALLDAFKSNSQILFHNAKFDVDVGEEHLGLPRLDWSRYHDTMFLLFLSDPHSVSFSLKPSAERLLGMKPDEQDAVAEWLVSNQPVPGVRITRSNFGAYISKAPGGLVGKYAKGDVVRTEKLFKKLYPEVAERGMLPAYDTERELMPILLDNEKQGVHVNLRKLETDFEAYTQAKAKIDLWIRKRLKNKDLNIDSDSELAQALDDAGIVTDWVLTPTGKRSTSKDNMTIDMFKDKQVGLALGYRSRLSTCVGTFMEPWLNVARETNGIIHTNWNQVRQFSRGDKNKGTRTGRLSSSPNFQNIPKDFYDKADGYEHPSRVQVPELPDMRDYLIPDKGELWVKRDYNQQELRLLAHYEDGDLCQAYNDDPNVDMHNFVRDRIKAIANKDYERRKVKITNFGIIYGQGAGSLAESMDCSVEESKELKKAHRKALPGVADLERTIKQVGRDGDFILTWGGRQYYVEPPAMIQGRLATFEYKLLNYLIQGSAADVTKRSIIRYNSLKKEGRFLITVHDENNLSVPKKAVKEEMKILKKAMNEMDFDVPMVSDGETGLSWGTLEAYKD